MAGTIEFPMTIMEIRRFLPHRFPFVMVDRVSEFVAGSHILGQKNVAANEPYFQGHFPEVPIMPGVLMLEAMAQMGALYAKLTPGGVPEDGLMVFSGADDVRFRRQVFPGDTLIIRMDNCKNRMGHWKMRGLITVDGEKAVEATIKATEVVR